MNSTAASITSRSGSSSKKAKAALTPDNHSSPTLPVYSISRAPTVTFVTPPGHIRPEPVILSFDSDDVFNNAIRTPDGKPLYLITTPKRTNTTIITGRREGASSSASLNAMDRPIATLIRNRWKSDKIAFGESPPSDVNKLFKTPTTSTMMSEFSRVTFSDETDRRFEWRGAHFYRALQLWTVDEPQLLIAQFRFPESGKPQLILEPPHEGFANIDMIIVTFLLLDKDRKRGQRRSDDLL